MQTKAIVVPQHFERVGEVLAKPSAAWVYEDVEGRWDACLPGEAVFDDLAPCKIVGGAV